jgi:hypothetical protein
MTTQPTAIPSESSSLQAAQSVRARTSPSASSGRPFRVTARSPGSEPEGTTGRSRSRQAPYVPLDRFARSLPGRTGVSRRPIARNAIDVQPNRHPLQARSPAQIRHFAPTEALCREGEPAQMPIWMHQSKGLNDSQGWTIGPAHCTAMGVDWRPAPRRVS